MEDADQSMNGVYIYLGHRLQLCSGSAGCAMQRPAAAAVTARTNRLDRASSVPIYLER